MSWYHAGVLPPRGQRPARGRLPGPNPALWAGCSVLRHGASVPCIRIDDLRPTGVGLVLPFPAEDGEILDLVLANRHGLALAEVRLAVTECNPTEGGYQVLGKFVEGLPRGAAPGFLC